MHSPLGLGSFQEDDVLGAFLLVPAHGQQPVALVGVQPSHRTTQPQQEVWSGFQSCGRRLVQALFQQIPNTLDGIQVRAVLGVCLLQKHPNILQSLP